MQSVSSKKFSQDFEVRPGKGFQGLSLGPVSACCHQEFGNILQCGSELSCMDDLSFRREDGQHSRAGGGSWGDLIHRPFLCWCRGTQHLRTRKPFSQPPLLVCLIFLILNLCLFLGVKCEILPRLCPLSLHLPHNSQERQCERCLYHTQKITSGPRTRSDPPTTAGRSYTQNDFRGEHLFLSYTLLKIASPKAKFKLMLKPHVNN